MNFDSLFKKVRIYSYLEILFGIFASVYFINVFIYWNNNIFKLIIAVLINAILFMGFT